LTPALGKSGKSTIFADLSEVFQQMKSDELMAQLCSALAANTHVKDLVLVNCNIGQNGCTSLGQAVSNHPSALDIP